MKMEIAVWPLDKIQPYENNSKIHDDAQVAGIATSIKKFGWDQPIVIDANGVIIKGHGRRLAAIKLGLTEVPVLVRADLSPTEVAAARLADNRVALGGMDTEKMRAEIASISVEFPEMLNGIYSTKELDFMAPSTDLGEINPGAFVDDLEGAVADQAAETERKLGEVDDREVPITKALGFKSIKIAAERRVTAFMAELEQSTGLKGAEAFIAHVNKVSGEV